MSSELEEGGASFFQQKNQSDLDRFSEVHVRVNFAGAPLVALHPEQGGHQAQQGGFVGEQSSDVRAAFEFPVHTFDGIAAASSLSAAKPCGILISIQAASLGALWNQEVKASGVEPLKILPFPPSPLISWALK